MKPGIYSGIPNEDYHSGPGISISGLKIIDERSPLHLRHQQLARLAERETAPRQQSKAFFIGSEFHALLLEPKEFIQGYTLAFRQQDMPDAIADRQQLVDMVERLNKTRLPKVPTTGTKDELIKRILEVNEQHGIENTPEVVLDLQNMKGADLKATLEAVNGQRPGLLSTTGSMADLAQLLRVNGEKFTLWTEVKEQWERNNGHRKILTHEQWQQVHAMRDSVMAHPSASALINAPGKAEQSIYWIDPETGVLCRIRPDWWRLDGLPVDVKTTEDASPEGFARSIARYGYHMQAAFYLDGITEVLKYLASKSKRAAKELPPPPKNFLFLVTEKTAPHATAVYALDQTAIEIGRAEYKRLLRIYADCMKNNAWPGYGGKIQNISLPDWSVRQSAHLIEA